MFQLTPAGQAELQQPSAGLSLPQRRLLSRIDGACALAMLVGSEPTLTADRIARDAQRLIDLDLISVAPPPAPPAPPPPPPAPPATPPPILDEGYQTIAPMQHQAPEWRALAAPTKAAVDASPAIASPRPRTGPPADRAAPDSRMTHESSAKRNKAPPTSEPAARPSTLRRSTGRSREATTRAPRLEVTVERFNGGAPIHRSLPAPAPRQQPRSHAKWWVAGFFGIAVGAAGAVFLLRGDLVRRALVSVSGAEVPSKGGARAADAAPVAAPAQIGAAAAAPQPARPPLPVAPPALSDSAVAALPPVPPAAVPRLPTGEAPLIVRPAVVDPPVATPRTQGLYEPVERVAPVFPADAPRDAPMTTVRARLLIDQEGAVSGVELLNTNDPSFERAATTALLRWRFAPGPPNRHFQADIVFRTD